MPGSLLPRRPPSTIVVLLLFLILQVMLAAARRSCASYRPVSVTLALVPTSGTTSATRTSFGRSAPAMSTKGAAFKTLAAPTEYEEVRRRQEAKWQGITGRFHSRMSYLLSAYFLKAFSPALPISPAPQALSLSPTASLPPWHLSPYPSLFSQVIKKSRFLTHAVSATSFAEAQDFLKRVSDLKATHNCWGWRYVRRETLRSSVGG